ncbi:MAG: tetraacyldisaccharide 4'-kinase [Cyclobacteriaceae bacterium]
MPEGRLRESRRGASRADVIVVTKCPETLSEDLKDEYRQRIGVYAPGTPVFFSNISYNEPRGGALDPKQEVILFSGIANPQQLREYAGERYKVISEHTYGDHHSFTKNELNKLVSEARAHNAALLTTEKDYRRIQPELLGEIEKSASLAYIPIETVVNNGQEFDTFIRNRIDKYASSR